MVKSCFGLPPRLVNTFENNPLLYRKEWCDFFQDQGVVVQASPRQGLHPSLPQPDMLAGFGRLTSHCSEEDLPGCSGGPVSLDVTLVMSLSSKTTPLHFLPGPVLSCDAVRAIAERCGRSPAQVCLRWNLEKGAWARSCPAPSINTYITYIYIYVYITTYIYVQVIIRLYLCLYLYRYMTSQSDVGSE